MNFKYRPDIDGLRAIAVISVMIFHAEFTFLFNETNYIILRGGFLGVDIFYVISGYLITYLIIEKEKKASFTFSNFYERRARRLLPVLFFAILISFIFGWIFMLPNQYKDFASSALSSIFFISNFWFYLTENYFSEASSLKPLLHTWSLSVEEQFYFIFPPIFYFLLKKKFKLLNLFNFLIICSLFLATYYSFKNQQLSFYILPTRLWELLCGSLMAYLHSKEKLNFKKKHNLLVILGLIFILLSVIFFNERIPNPSIFSAIVVLGTSFVIFFNNKSIYIYKFLSNKFLVKIGLISYSLYIWHFPVFAFKKIKSDGLSNFDKLESIILIIFLSIFSYFLIEKPFRNNKIILKKYFFILLSIFFVLLVFLSLYIYKTNGLPKRYGTDVLKLINFDYEYSVLYQKDTCHISLKENISKNLYSNCKVEIFKNKKNLYLWGDSLAAHLFPGIKFKYEKNFNIFQKTADACKPTSLLREKLKKTRCYKINEFIYDEIINLKPSKIFISAGWDENDLILLNEIINNLKKNNIPEIYIVGPSPRWHDPLPKILFKKYRLTKNIPKLLYDENQIINFELDEKLNEIANKNFVKYVSPIKILCVKDYRCLTKVDESPDSILTWDENHFTEKASKYIFKNIID